MINEYEITYVTKEYLRKKGWEILAYNPPGSQGTFTIPNPNKDHAYRGQTGSVSPDIVAFKNDKKTNLLLVVESKPEYDKEDIDKMISMFKTKERRDVFIKIIEKQSEANNININKHQPIEIIFGKAHGGDAKSHKGIITFHIKQLSEWNPSNFKADEDILSHYSVTEINPC